MVVQKRYKTNNPEFYKPLCGAKDQKLSKLMLIWKEMLKDVSENPLREIRILLSSIEKKPQEFYFLYPDSTLSDAVVDRMRSFLMRRQAHEPLSKIIGEREFYGRSFKVTQDTLDPRSDSETLIDAVLNYGNTLPKPLRILDLGTGTGCLLLTLLAELPDATGVGIDLSENALDVARYNAKHLGLADRSTFLKSHWFDALQTNDVFSLIVSNPPYIQESADLETNVLDYDPHLALFAGEDGLNAYRALAPEFKKYLRPDGMVVVEFGQGQEGSVRSLFEMNALNYVQQVKDIQGITRCAIFA